MCGQKLAFFSWPFWYPCKYWKNNTWHYFQNIPNYKTTSDEKRKQTKKLFSAYLFSSLISIMLVCLLCPSSLSPMLMPFSIKRRKKITRQNLNNKIPFELMNSLWNSSREHRALLIHVERMLSKSRCTCASLLSLAVSAFMLCHGKALYTIHFYVSIFQIVMCLSIHDCQIVEWTHSQWLYGAQQSSGDNKNVIHRENVF